MSERVVAIAGGGITGLAIAEAIMRRSSAEGAPIRPLVLEAEATPGGKIKSAREDGFVVDHGPHAFLDREPKALELVDRLALRTTLLRANDSAAKRYVVRKGRLRRLPESPPAFIASDVLPLFAKLRVLLEPWARRRPAGIDESVWAFAARRIGRGAADVLVDAMVTGIFGGDAKALSLAAAFPRMRELEDRYGSLIRAQIALARERKALPPGPGAGAPAGGGGAGAPVGAMYSFREGLGELTRALSARVEVRTGAPVERIERAGPRFRVLTGDAALEVDAVALATPAYETSRLVAPLAAEEAAAIAGIPYAPVAVVILAYPAAALARPLDGFGFLAPHIEARTILGSIWASSVFPAHVPEGRVMLRTMVGGARRPELVGLDDQSLLALVQAELVALVGLRPGADPLFQRILRWDRAIPQYVLGHAERVAAADRVEAAVPGLLISGNAFRGVAMIACIADADRVAARAVAHVLKGG